MKNVNQQVEELGLNAGTTQPSAPVADAISQVQKFRGMVAGTPVPDAAADAIDKRFIATKTEPFLFPGSNFQIGGIGFQTERDLYGAVDWRKVLPNVSMTEVMNVKDPEVFAIIDSAKSFIDSQGNAFDVSGMSVEDKIKQGDKRGASFIVDENDEEFEIPWYKGVNQLTAVDPDKVDIRTGVLNDGVEITTADITPSDLKRVRSAYMIASMHAAPPEVARPLYAAYLDNIMIENGVDARSRFSILRDAREDPSMGDFEKVVFGAVDTVGRSIIETSLYGVGEAVGFFTGESFRDEDDVTSIASYQGRQAFMDDKFASFPQRLQNRYARKGVFIDLATAEEIAYTYSGLLPRATRLAAELLSVSKGSGAVKGLIAKGELNNFENYLARVLSKDPDAKMTTVLKNYERDKDVFFLSPIRILGKRDRIKVYENRIATAYQIVDSKLPGKFRAEVQQVRKRQAILLQRKRALKKQQSRRYSEETNDELNRIETEINQNRNAMMDAERISSRPKYMRDTLVQDAYMIVGASTVGHFFGQEFDMIDPAFGELAGLIVGLTTAVSQGSIPRGLRAFNQRRRDSSNFDYLTADNRKNLRYLVNQFSQANPAFADRLEANAMRIANSFDKLEAQGVDRKFLSASIPIVVDLITLRHYADAVKKSIKSGDAFDMKMAEQFQEAFEGLQDLNGELNRVMNDMIPENMAMADNEFFTFMRAMADQGRALQKSIDSDLRVINEKGIAHYMNAITANTDIIVDGAIDSLSDDASVKTFSQAVGGLIKRNIFDETYIDREAVERASGVAIKEINGSLISAAAQIQNSMGHPVDPSTTVGPSLLPRHRNNISKTTSGSTLFAFQLEAANEFARGSAAYPYEILKNPSKVRFETAGGKPLSNNITVDTSDIFSQLIGARKTALDAEGVSVSLTDELIIEISDPIFEELARSQKTTVPKLLQDMKVELEAKGFVFGTGANRKRSLQAQVADFMHQSEALEGFDSGMFRMDPMGLRKLDDIVREEAHNANQAGRGGVAQALYRVSDTNIENKFNEFVVDGEPVGNLMIIIEGEGRFELKRYLDDANDGWRSYKERFHDKVGGAMVPNLLFNKRVNLLKPTAEFPTGTGTAKLPSQWLTPDMLINPVKAENYMAGINGAMGREILDPVSGMVTRRLVDGDDFTEGQKAIVTTVLAEWVEANIKTGKLSQDEIATTLESVSKNLRMVSADGKTDMPLVNFVGIIDDHTRLSGKSISKVRYTQEMEKAESIIQRQLDGATAQARELSEGLKDASDVIGRLTSDNLAAADIASVLIDGGMERYNQIRNNMLKLVDSTTGGPKYTVDKVDEILSAAYISGMRRKLFSKSGKKEARIETRADGKIETTFTDMLIENPKQLLKFLGETEEEVQVAKSILGKDRYETIEAIANVLTELTDNPLAQSPITVRGIPRALSVESYISRLYAINRGVVRPQYVGTEAVLQSLRFKNHEFLTALVTDPELGRAFIEMARTGKPLSPQRNLEFQAALVQHYALYSQAFPYEKEDVVDVAGRKFTVNATPSDKVNLGYPADYEGQLDPKTYGPAQEREKASRFGPAGTPFGGFDIMPKPEYSLFEKVIKNVNQ